MPTKLKILAIAAALATSASTAAMAQYACAPGYTYYNGVCQPARPLGDGNPVSGAVSGEAAGAANGYATGGPVGAVVGGAIGTATGAVRGTANAVSGAVTPTPTCAYGYTYYNGGCYPASNYR